MLGLVVLLIALLLHFTGYRRYSLLLFVFMALRYMKIVPMAVMAVNGIDLAIVYMIIVTVSQRIQTLALQKILNCYSVSADSPFPNYIFAVGMIYYGLTPFNPLWDAANCGCFRHIFSKRRTKR